MNQRVGSVFPFVFFSNRDLIADPVSASQTMTKLMVPARIEAMEPDGRLDVTISCGIMPGVHLWLLDIRQGIELRVLTVEDRQIIYLPGKGELIVETPQGSLVSDQIHGLNIEAENLLRVRFFPGRSGAGMAIDRPALLQRLAILLDVPVRRRLEFETRFDASIGHRTAVGDMIRAVTSPALGAALTASPVTASKLSATMLDIVLQSLPHNHSEALLKPPAQIAPRHVKRAMDYIQAHARSPITIDELADVCQVSIRSLQYGFRQFLDISPADHIRSVRLEGARRAIVDGAQTTLTEIANEWGFSNLTRFNTQFKAAYGETPAEIRRRHRGQV